MRQDSRITHEDPVEKAAYLLLSIGGVNALETLDA